MLLLLTTIKPQPMKNKQHIKQLKGLIELLNEKVSWLDELAGEYSGMAEDNEFQDDNQFINNEFQDVNQFISQILSDTAQELEQAVDVLVDLIDEDISIS